MLTSKMEGFPRSLCARVTLTSCVLILCLSWCNGLSIRPFGNTFVGGAPGYNCTRNSVCNETRLCPPGCPCTLNGIPCLSGSVCAPLQGFSGLFCLCPTNTTLNTTTNSCVNSTVTPTQPANAAPIIAVVNTRRDPGSTRLTGPGLKIAGGPTKDVNATIRACRQTSNPNDDGETRRLNLQLVVTNGVTLASCNIALVETYLDVKSRRNFRNNNFCTRRDFLFNNRPNRVSTTKFVDVNLRNGRFILTSGPPEGPRRGFIVQRYSITCTGTNGLPSNTVEFFVAFPSCRGCNFQNKMDNCPIANGRGRENNCNGLPDGVPSRRTRLPCLAFYTANAAEPQDCTRLYLKGERPVNRMAVAIRSSSSIAQDLDREDMIDSVPKDIQPDGVGTSSQQVEEELDDEEETAPETTQASVQKPEDVDHEDDDEDVEGVTTTERPQQANGDNDDDKDDIDEE